jgi:hypothetical protein
MNQPKKDPFHLYSLGPHSPQFQQSAGATHSVVSLVKPPEKQQQKDRNQLNLYHIVYNVRGEVYDVMIRHDWRIQEVQC